VGSPEVEGVLLGDAIETFKVKIVNG